jgi:hypothetical protein
MCLTRSRFLKRFPLQRVGYFSSKEEEKGRGGGASAARSTNLSAQRRPLPTPLPNQTNEPLFPLFFPPPGSSQFGRGSGAGGGNHGEDPRRLLLRQGRLLQVIPRASFRAATLPAV